MQHSHRRQVVGVILTVLLLLVAYSPPFRSLAQCPDQLRLLVGEEEHFDLIGLPLSAVIRGDQDGLLHINDSSAREGIWRVNLASPLAFRPLSQGSCELELSLFGVVPLKRIAVEVVPRVMVEPSGQSIGILLRTRGVVVVGHAPVETSDGVAHYPARDAGVRVGDTITAVDGAEVRSNQHIVFLVNRCAREGRPAPVTIERQGIESVVEIVPEFCDRERVFQIGLYVRDGAAGVGTMTFIEPESGVFMALGHVIADASTNQPLMISDGRVVRAAVARIRPGRRGEPGEKEGTFIDNRDIIGEISHNTEFGLVGRLTGDGRAWGEHLEPLPVALAREVRIGPAEILTVVDGYQIGRFAIEISDADTLQGSPAPKGITVRVTDPALLEATGGIVQGMSGSPIIQDGRLVGAVTHVFVNDPSRGYGVFAEWMVREAGLYPSAGQGRPMIRSTAFDIATVPTPR